MPSNADLSIPALTWTQLTTNDIGAIRVTNISSGAMILLKATVGITAPTDRDGAIPLAAGSTWAADLTIAQVWPGISGANRIWAFSQDASRASVSHA